jgi:hypothetical protein
MEEGGGGGGGGGDGGERWGGGGGSTGDGGGRGENTRDTHLSQSVSYDETAAQTAIAEWATSQTAPSAPHIAVSPKSKVVLVDSRAKSKAKVLPMFDTLCYFTRACHAVFFNSRPLVARACILCVCIWCFACRCDAMEQLQC